MIKNIVITTLILLISIASTTISKLYLKKHIIRNPSKSNKYNCIAFLFTYASSAFVDFALIVFLFNYFETNLLVQPDITFGHMIFICSLVIPEWIYGSRILRKRYINEIKKIYPISDFEDTVLNKYDIGIYWQNAVFKGILFMITMSVFRFYGFIR